LSIQPTLLSIAGSDPSGGAGIQADLKTMTSIGVYGAAAITCLTVQNSLGVQKISPLPADFVQAQIQAVLEDHNVTHIKIGMTGTVEILQGLGHILRSFSGEIIYDPVLASTTGESLLQADGIEVLKGELLHKVAYLTPNISELQLLSKINISSRKDAVSCAELLLHTCPSLKAVLVKGGHLDETSSDISDFMVRRDGKIDESRRKRIQNNNLHGTGCTYSSALASYLCLGNDPVTAFRLAGEYMDKIIRGGVQISVVRGPDNGPLMHCNIDC
jgi:hydroxymethylpyrimidine/phosphomethylpyrimidine kinase